MLTFFRKYSIRWQLIFIGGVILLILAATAVWSYFRILDITYERNSEYTLEIISTIKSNIESHADTINRIMPNITYNEAVQDYLRETEPLERYKAYLKVEVPLLNLKSMKNGILEIVLIGSNGNTYNCVNCTSDIPYGDIPERTGSYYLGIHPTPSTVRVNAGDSPRIEHVVYFGAPIYDNQTGQKIGYAIMVLDVKAIAPEIDRMSRRTAGNFYVLDRNGVVYASNDATRIGEGLSWFEQGMGRNPKGDIIHQNGERFVVHTESLPHLNSTISSVFPMADLYRGLEAVQRHVVIVFVLLVGVMSVLYVMVSRNILLPLRSFISYIYGIRSKGLNTIRNRVDVNGYAEITVLSHQFNALLDEIDDLAGSLVTTKTQIIELQLLKQQAELQFLKSQINPHFLYNTLETMKGIAHVRGVEEIRKMADALSLMFRYSIKGGEIVTLREEIEIVEAYLDIQQVRFAGRFSVQRDYDPACYDISMIKMIVQPIVENAIFHGIEPSLKKGTLTIGCRLEAGGDLILWVWDDGVGMDADKLDRIRRSLDGSGSPDPTNRNHIGILNVHDRIRFTYGDSYGITAIDSDPERGTKVTIRMPVGGSAHVQSGIGGR